MNPRSKRPFRGEIPKNPPSPSQVDLLERFPELPPPPRASQGPIGATPPSTPTRHNSGSCTPSACRSLSTKLGSAGVGPGVVMRWVRLGGPVGRPPEFGGGEASRAFGHRRLRHIPPKPTRNWQTSSTIGRGRTISTEVRRNRSENGQTRPELAEQAQNGSKSTQNRATSPKINRIRRAGPDGASVAQISRLRVRDCERCAEIEPPSPDYFLDPAETVNRRRPQARECAFGPAGSLPTASAKPTSEDGPEQPRTRTQVSRVFLGCVDRLR